MESSAERHRPAYAAPDGALARRPTFLQRWHSSGVYQSAFLQRLHSSGVYQCAPWRPATMSKVIEQIPSPKPEAPPRLYADSIADKAHAGLFNVGQTTRDVTQRLAEQLKN